MALFCLLYYTSITPMLQNVYLVTRSVSIQTKRFFPPSPEISFYYCLDTKHAFLEICVISLVVILYNHTEHDFLRGYKSCCGLWFSCERDRISCILTREKGHLPQQLLKFVKQSYKAKWHKQMLLFQTPDFCHQ